MNCSQETDYIGTAIANAISPPVDGRAFRTSMGLVFSGDLRSTLHVRFLRFRTVWKRSCVERRRKHLSPIIRKVISEVPIPPAILSNPALDFFQTASGSSKHRWLITWSADCRKVQLMPSRQPAGNPFGVWILALLFCFHFFHLALTPVIANLISAMAMWSGIQC